MVRIVESRAEKPDGGFAPRLQEAISQFSSLTLSSSLCYSPRRNRIFPGRDARDGAWQGQPRVQPLHRRVFEEFSESLLPRDLSLRRLKCVCVGVPSIHSAYMRKAFSSFFFFTVQARPLEISLWEVWNEF